MCKPFWFSFIKSIVVSQNSILLTNFFKDILVDATLNEPQANIFIFQENSINGFYWVSFFLVRKQTFKYPAKKILKYTRSIVCSVLLLGVIWAFSATGVANIAFLPSAMVFIVLPSLLYELTFAFEISYKLDSIE